MTLARKGGWQLGRRYQKGEVHMGGSSRKRKSGIGPHLHTSKRFDTALITNVGSRARNLEVGVARQGREWAANDDHRRLQDADPALHVRSAQSP